MNGFWAILLKEFTHLRRDRTTLLFTLGVPLLQMTIFGFAIQVTIENIPLAVLDLDGRQDSRRLVDAMVNTRTFQVVRRVNSLEGLRRSLTSGAAKAGLLIPADYSERLLRGEQAEVQLLIDGSDSQVASTALNAGSLLVMQMAVGRARMFGEAMQMAPSRGVTGKAAVPIELRPRMLYNPDLKSSHFFVPGLIAIILQVVLVFLTSFSIVKELEMGTLEQLFVTPVGRLGLLFGKLIPYTLLAFAELLVILVVMRLVFDVPINGRLAVLIGLSLLFIVTALGLGLLISTVSSTQLQAMQFAALIMLPSVLLSGFVFPRSEMPWPLWAIGFVLPVTYFVEILRGVILRGAEIADLVPHIFGLAICCAVILGLSLMRFRKQVG